MDRQYECDVPSTEMILDIITHTYTVSQKKADVEC